MGFRFENLDVWNEANAFAQQVYIELKMLPQTEVFGLGDQLRRAVNSVPVNIAEGSGSSSRKDFAHFLNISIRSAYEVVALLYRCEQEGFLPSNRRMELSSMAEVLVKRIQKFRASLLR